jgi:hypothetical protein
MSHATDRHMAPPRGSRLILDLDLSDDYLSGTVTGGQQADRAFSGRLGLLSAIEAEVARLSAGTSAVEHTGTPIKGGRA